MPLAPTKDCLFCNSAFSKPYVESMKAWTSRHKYCSRVCCDKAKIGVKHSPEHIAKIRAKPFQAHGIDSRARLKGESHWRWKGGPPKCIDCGKSLANRYSKRCHPCNTKHQKGHNAAHWQGGITPLNLGIRNLPEYTAWRQVVFQRDGFACVQCGEGGHIHADHIKPFARILLEQGVASIRDAKHCAALWDVQNGRTLCVPCHKKTKTYAGKVRKLLKNANRQLAFQSILATQDN